MRRTIKNQFASLLFICFSFCYAGCSNDQRIHTESIYYPNGKLKAKATMKGKMLHGLITWYYPNGKIESISNWADGKRNGSTKTYSYTGNPTEFINYRNDVKLFNLTFDSTGKPMERQTFNSSGGVILTTPYDAEGKPGSSFFSPIVQADDTITLGNKFSGFVTFGYPLKSKATMLVGRLGKDMKALDRYPLLDTFQVVHQSKDGRFYFSFASSRLGANTFAYKFIQPGNPWTDVPKDSLSVDLLSGSRPFYVRKSTVQR